MENSTAIEDMKMARYPSMYSHSSRTHWMLRSHSRMPRRTPKTITLKGEITKVSQIRVDRFIYIYIYTLTHTHAVLSLGVLWSYRRSYWMELIYIYTTEIKRGGEKASAFSYVLLWFTIREDKSSFMSWRGWLCGGYKKCFEHYICRFFMSYALTRRIRNSIRE